MWGRSAGGEFFERTKAHLETGDLPPPPSWEERVQVVAEHLSLKCEWLGERTGVLEMRKNYSSYFKGFRTATTLRNQVMKPETKEGVLEVIVNFKPDAPDIQVPSASLPQQTADPNAVDTKKPDVRDDLPSPWKRRRGRGGDEEGRTARVQGIVAQEKCRCGGLGIRPVMGWAVLRYAGSTSLSEHVNENFVL